MVLLNMLINLFKKKEYTVVVVSLFVFSWTFLGNINSILYSSKLPLYRISFASLLYLVFFIILVLLVGYSFVKEIVNLKKGHKLLKIAILAQVFLCSLFVFAPPRNADAMRVWLAKPMDVLIHGEKILRPYAHYNIPDAFTLFHLPVLEIGDGQFFMLSIFTCFVAVLALLTRICIRLQRREVVLCCLGLFALNPFITLGATVIISDMPVILAVSGMIYAMLRYKENNSLNWILVILLFFSFGLNIKYNMLMFLPALFIWFAIEHHTIFACLKKITIYQFVFLISILFNSVYPYFINYLYIGNPVWPAATKLFAAHEQSWDIAANNLTQGFLSGDRSLHNLVVSLFNIVTMPHHINPLAIFIGIFIFRKHKHLSFVPALFVVSYILILWIMMPKFGESEKERYILYLFPIIIPFGLTGFFEFWDKAFRNNFALKISQLMLIGSLVFYGGFNIFYSFDTIKYLVSGNKTEWHKHTWYYSEYQWISNNIDLNDQHQIMVYARSQITYYLKKRYINIDPISGYFKDEKTFESVNSFVEAMEDQNIAYIFVDWSAADPKLKKMLNDLETLGRASTMKTWKSFISSSRLFNKGSFHEVRFYRVSI